MLYYASNIAYHLSRQCASSTTTAMRFSWYTGRLNFSLHLQQVIIDLGLLNTNAIFHLVSSATTITVVRAHISGFHTFLNENLHFVQHKCLQWTHDESRLALQYRSQCIKHQRKTAVAEIFHYQLGETNTTHPSRIALADSISSSRT